MLRQSPNHKERCQGKKKKEGTKKELEKQPKTINRVTISTFLSINPLNTNGLNAQMTKSD